MIFVFIQPVTFKEVLQKWVRNTSPTLLRSDLVVVRGVCFISKGWWLNPFDELCFMHIEVHAKNRYSYFTVLYYI